MEARLDTDAGGGLRVEVCVASPGDCPAAALSREADAPVTGVRRASPAAGDAFVEDLTVLVDEESEGASAPEIYRSGGQRTYRVAREPPESCVCAAIESLGVPIADVQAREGALELTFFVDDVTDVKRVVELLRSSFDGVSIRYLSRSGEGAAQDLVVVDRARLTDRQREVLTTAHELGYFDYPKGANAAEVATELGIAPSTFAEHLAVSQSKLLDAILSP